MMSRDKPLSPVNIKLNDRNVNRRKKKDGYFKKKLVEFCKRTDFHGFKYVVMKELSFFERCCWAAAIIISAACAGFFVVTAYQWYARNPIITVIESTHGAIWDIPFPAITICDLNLISRSAARTFADNVDLPENISPDDIYQIVRYSPFLSTPLSVPQPLKDKLNMLQGVLDGNNISITDFFDMLSPAQSCSDLIERCMWKNTLYRCELLFHQIFTQFSRCCIFNYYAIDNFDASSPNEMFQPETPRRVASCGYQTALTVLLNTDSGDYHSTLIASNGALVLIDNAYNVPTLSSPMRMVGPATEVFIALSPERTYATSGIRAFHPSERQCYFSDEVNLGKIKQYSYHNCKIYNSAIKAYENCGCMPHYIPAEVEYRTCNFSDMACLELYTLEGEVNNTSDVECLPDCEHYDYPLEVAQGFLATDVSLEGISFYKDVQLENRSLLNIFFNDLVTTRYRRDVYLNWQNLLASFGGLLSLMLGFTLISAIDFVFFFTFRVVYDCCASVRNSSSKSQLANNKIFVQEGPRVDHWLKQNKSGTIVAKSDLSIKY